jgi:hypothetical protein
MGTVLVEPRNGSLATERYRNKSEPCRLVHAHSAMPAVLESVHVIWRCPQQTAAVLTSSGAV